MDRKAGHTHLKSIGGGLPVSNNSLGSRHHVSVFYAAVFHMMAIDAVCIIPVRSHLAMMYGGNLQRLHLTQLETLGKEKSTMSKAWVSCSQNIS